MTALPYLKHAPLNRHRDAMEACRAPSEADRMATYLHSLARQFDAHFHNARVQDGMRWKQQFAERASRMAA